MDTQSPPSTRRRNWRGHGLPAETLVSGTDLVSKVAANIDIRRSVEDTPSSSEQTSALGKRSCDEGNASGEVLPMIEELREEMEKRLEETKACLLNHINAELATILQECAKLESLVSRLDEGLAEALSNREDSGMPFRANRLNLHSDANTTVIGAERRARSTPRAQAPGRMPSFDSPYSAKAESLGARLAATEAAQDELRSTATRLSQRLSDLESSNVRLVGSEDHAERDQIKGEGSPPTFSCGESQPSRSRTASSLRQRGQTWSEDLDVSTSSIGVSFETYAELARRVNELEFLFHASLEHPLQMRRPPVSQEYSPRSTETGNSAGQSPALQRVLPQVPGNVAERLSHSPGLSILAARGARGWSSTSSRASTVNPYASGNWLQQVEYSPSNYKPGQ